jgi:hypothetical protein
MQENIITDRTIIDVMAFAQASKSMDQIEKDDFSTLARQLIKEYDYIFYIDPAGVKMEDNGVRETDLEYRDLIDFTIRNTISNNKFRMKNFSILAGTVEERIEQLKETLSL